MRKPIIIGNHVFKYKKDAIAYYKSILNFYDFGDSLSEGHFNDIIDLLIYDESFDETEIEENGMEIPVKSQETGQEDELFIESIRIAKVQYGTKCFELVWNDLETELISYLSILNRPKYLPEATFRTACRNIIQKDLHAVKQAYFDQNSVKGVVKCQETNIFSSWTELAVDHRQPLTFSMIVDRFVELNSIDIEKVEYKVLEDNRLIFADPKLAEDFRNYHKAKANLRIVRKEQNAARAHLARIKSNQKDLRGCFDFI